MSVHPQSQQVVNATSMQVGAQQLEEYLNHYLSEPILSLFKNAYQRAIENKQQQQQGFFGSENPEVQFIEFCKGIREWNQDVILRNVKEIQSKISEPEVAEMCMERLILSQSALIANITATTTVDVPIPAFSNFLHKVLVFCGVEFQNWVQLFRVNTETMARQTENDLALMKRIRESIKKAALDSIPMRLLVGSKSSAAADVKLESSQIGDKGHDKLFDIQSSASVRSNLPPVPEEYEITPDDSVSSVNPNNRRRHHRNEDRSMAPPPGKRADSSVASLRTLQNSSVASFRAHREHKKPDGDHRHHSRHNKHSKHSRHNEDDERPRHSEYRRHRRNAEPEVHYEYHSPQPDKAKKKRRKTELERLGFV